MNTNNFNLKFFLLLILPTINCSGMWHLSGSSTTSSNKKTTYTFSNNNGRSYEQYSEVNTQYTDQGPVTSHTQWAKENDKLTYHSNGITRPSSKKSKNNFDYKLRFGAKSALLASFGIMFILAMCYKYFIQGQDKEEQIKTNA